MALWRVLVIATGCAKPVFKVVGCIITVPFFLLDLLLICCFGPELTDWYSKLRKPLVQVGVLYEIKPEYLLLSSEEETKEAPDEETRLLYEYQFVWFNAWVYSGSDCLWTALIQSLYKAVEERYGSKYAHAKRRAQLYSTLCLVFVSLVVVAAGVAGLQLGGAGTEHTATSVAELVSEIAAIGSGFIFSVYRVYVYISTAGQSTPSEEIGAMAAASKDKLGYMNDVKQELHTIADWLQNPQQLPTFWTYLLPDIFFKLFGRSWLPGGSYSPSLPCRLVIFVDDLDRCSQKGHRSCWCSEWIREWWWRPSSLGTKSSTRSPELTATSTWTR